VLKRQSSELESTSPELAPASLLQGYFRFESPTLAGTGYLVGAPRYTELLEFVIETSQGSMTVSSGIVTEGVAPRPITDELNPYLVPRPSPAVFLANVGAVAYPPTSSANVLTGVSSSTGSDDTLDSSIDFPWVPDSLLTLKLYLGNERTISVLGGSLHPSTLDQTWTSELTLYNQGANWGTILTDDVSLQTQNYSATYNITSLSSVSNAPEPTTITLLSLGMLLPLLIRHRA